MKKLRFLILGILFLSGCATVPEVAPTRIPEGMPGVYHRMEKGQTLWRISKAYNVDLDELVKVNHISDVTNIEVGQLIFIPKAARQKQVIVQVQSQEDFVWPVKGRVVSHYGNTFKNMLNKGLNIESSGGQDIVASRSGRVVFYSPRFKGYGKAIIIDHGDNFSTVYSGNFESQVKPGDSVIKGNAIARFNPAGNKRLHFEIRKGSYSQNPYFYLQ